MNNITAAIFDVDGTLFDYRSGKIPKSTINAIQALKRKNVTIIVATARSYSELSDDLLDSVEADYYVVASGHSIQDRAGRNLYSICFRCDQVEILKNIVLKYNTGLTLKYGNCSCIYNHPEEMQAIFSNIGVPRCSILYCPTMDHHLSALPIGFTINAPPEIRSDICKELSNYPNDFRLELFANKKVADIYSPFTNKMTALSHLTDSLGIRPNECIAFGDGRNDIQMIKWAGLGVAMGNACDELKKAAVSICGATWEDGIYTYLLSSGLI